MQSHQTNNGHTLLWLIESTCEAYKKLGKDNEMGGRPEPDEHVRELSMELASRMNLSPDEALLFAVVFYICAEDGYASTRDIARQAHIPLRDHGKMMNGLLSLYQKGVLFKEDDNKMRSTFQIVPDVYKAILSNESPMIRDLKTDVYGCIEKLNEYIQSIDEGRMDIGLAYEYIKRLYAANSSLPVARLIKKLKLSRDETVMLSAIFVIAASGERMFSTNRMCNVLFKSIRSHIMARRYFFNDNSKLMKSGIIEFKDGEFMTRETGTITKAGVERMYGEEAATIFTLEREAVDALINPETIEVKRLYYNAAEEEQIHRLAKLLSPGQFESLKVRLKERSMLQGATVLFYGGPGTGKTETVLQLARSTGRSVMPVDVSTIKDKWVGESEKNARSIFTRYRSLCEKMELTPILLLNECDSILFRRINVTTAVDQSFNSIQNILLEELEKFNGILFATTNLIGNLDPAFDRRLLFKLKFENPTAETRGRIIRERLPFLTEKEAMDIASSYNLSGGQCENIARKAFTEELMTGSPVGFDLVKRFCEEETSYRKSGNSRNTIGFRLEE